MWPSAKRPKDPPLTPPSEGRGINSFEGGTCVRCRDTKACIRLQGPCLVPALKQCSIAVLSSVRQTASEKAKSCLTLPVRGETSHKPSPRKRQILLRRILTLTQRKTSKTGWRQSAVSSMPFRMNNTHCSHSFALLSDLSLTACIN